MSPTNTAGTLARILLSQLQEHPDNRQHFDPTKMSELTTSLREQGQLARLVVRPIDGGKFQIIYGHRRARAAAALKWEALDCEVREMDDGEALLAMMIENLQREDVGPFDEQRYFETLQVQGYTHEMIAIEIGKPASYVAGRLALANLIEPIRKLLAKGVVSLPVAMAVAPLQEAQQKELHDQYSRWDEEWPTLGRARQDIHRMFLLDLKDAPWDLGDATLVEQAGPCEGCPKRSVTNPDLFGQTTDQDRCTDAACHDLKTAAFLQRQHATLATAGEKAVNITDDWYTRRSQSVLCRSEYTLSKKGGCPNTERGVVAEGNNVGTLRYICRAKKCKVHQGKVQQRTTSRGSDPGYQREQRRRRWESQVASAINKATTEKVLTGYDGKDLPGLWRLLALDCVGFAYYNDKACAAFLKLLTGTEDAEPQKKGTTHAREKAIAALILKADVPTLRKLVMVDKLSEAERVMSGARTDRMIQPVMASVLADLKIDPKAIRAAAVKAHPKPTEKKAKPKKAKK